MRKYTHLYEQICTLENLELADDKARKGKCHQPAIIEHDKNKEEDLLMLRAMLINKRFITSKYTTFKIFEPKEREIFRLPYFPDRILHHAIINIIGPKIEATFTGDTFSCIKGRGIHGALYALREALKDERSTRYCLKIDIQKFYPSVDHEILKTLLRKKFKDHDLFLLLDNIIDSAPGLPIGNLLSQIFSNFYLTPFDYFIKNGRPHLKYLRYADDMIFLLDTKEELHKLLACIRVYLWNELKLRIKSNYQLFPVDARGIDAFGYVCFHHKTWVRKSIKQRFARKIRKGINNASIPPYVGWLKHANAKHLLKKILCTASAN